ncbi:MAG: endonuclease [Bacteroidales bacterium]
MLKKIFSYLAIVYIIQYVAIAQIPNGYYDPANGLTGAPLKTALYNIIKGHTDKGYDGLYACYTTTDNLPSGKVWDMYSIKANDSANYWYTNSASNSNQCGNYNSEGDCYNREHSFCDSWLGQASPQRSDLFHVYPTDGYVNNRRSSYPHGKVGSASWTSSNGSKLGISDPSTGYTGIVFEPIDQFKGDFARSYFYVATRYENLISGWSNNGSASELLAGNSYPAFKTWFLNLMIQWCTQDPVSQKEIDRNNAVYAYQHNRNPYIDHPEYIAAVWGSGTNISTTANDLSGKISVYPNPVKEKLNIDIYSSLTLPENISVTDISGRIIYHSTQVTSHQQIDVSSFESGMYFVIVSGRDCKSVLKFIR